MLEGRRPSAIQSPPPPSQLGWDDDFVMVELVSAPSCPKLLITIKFEEDGNFEILKFGWRHVKILLIGFHLDGHT